MTWFFMIFRKPFWVGMLAVLLLTAACKPVINFFSFHPNDSFIVAKDAMPPDTSEVFFQTSDGVRILALYLANPSSDTITIYFHGNAGNVYSRLPDFAALRDLGTGVFAVSYRGYGKSEGSPSEEGIYRDAEAAYEYVTTQLQFPAHKVFVFGRSIGSTAAIDMARGRNLAGLILVSPLSSGREQARVIGLPFGESVAGDAFPNTRKIPEVRAPLLVIHGDQDKLIPIDFGRAVFDAAVSEKLFREIAGAGHNDLSRTYATEYWGIVQAFYKNIRSK